MKELLGKLSGKENRTTLILVSVAVLGILIFILTSATFPFKDLLFDKLFPNPPSKAATVFPNMPEKGSWGFETLYIDAMLVTDNAVYLGGNNLRVAGPNTGTGVPISSASATPV